MKVKLLALVANFAAIVCLSAQQSDTLKSVNLQEVYVSAFRIKSIMKELPQSVQVLSRKDIREIPNESVSDLLKKTASIDIVEYPGFSSNIGMRGFAPTAHGSTYTMMLVNGIPSGTQNPSTLDLVNVEQIEILKGPYSAFYGSGAMAGVVNIVTPQSKGKLNGLAGVSAGSFQTYSFNTSLGGNIMPKLNFDLSFKAFSQGKDYKTGSKNMLSNSTLEKEILGNTRGKTFDNTSYNKYNAKLRLGYEIARNWQLNIFEEMFVADHILANGNFWGVYGSNEKQIKRWSQSLSAEGNLGSHTLKLAPYLNNEDVDYYNNISDSSFVTTNYNFKSYGVVLQDAFTFGNHGLIVGIDNHSQHYVNKQWSKREMRKAPYQPDYANIANGAFVQSRFSFLESKLSTSLGVRYDLIYFKVFETDFIKSANANETYQTFNPNFSIRYEIVPGLNVKAGAGTAFMAPDAFKKTGLYTSGIKVYKGNPNLDPETSLSYDVGVTWSKAGLLIGATWFSTSHKGLLVYDRSNKDTTTFKNADDAQMSGLEFSFALDFGKIVGSKYSFKLYGNATHLLNSEVTVDNKTQDMKYVRRNNGAFGLEFSDNKNWVLRTNARYIGRRLEDNWLYGYDSKTGNNVPLLDANGESIRPSLINQSILEHPDFLVCDFTASYTLKERYVLGVAIQNLFDENYTEKDTYNMPGRSVMGSLTIKF